MTIVEALPLGCAAELHPVGNLVRLSTEELAVVTAEHPTDPFRPQVKIITDSKGTVLENPLLTNTWELDSRGEHARAVVEAVDPEEAGIDPLKFLDANPAPAP